MISNVIDITADWDKDPFKLGPGQPGPRPGQPSQDWSAASLDPNVGYYVISKALKKNNYGTFKAGIDVPLFSFQGNSCLGVVRIIEPNEPFINAAAEIFALDVVNLFNSRSGGRQANGTPLQQFRVVAGTSARCSDTPVVLGANSDTQTTPSDLSVDTPVLFNDTKDGGPAPISDINLRVTVPPTKGTASVNADGSIKYTPNRGATGTDLYTYSICDKSLPTVCKEATVTIAMTVPTTDLSIVKEVSGSVGRVNNSLRYRITVENKSVFTATNVQVRDQLPVELNFISDGGFREGESIVWNIPTFPAGEISVFTYEVIVKSQGVIYNTATVNTPDQIDTDLSNNSSTACVSVPVEICQGESLELSAEGSAVVEWYKDDVLFTTANKIIITESGSYTNKASNSTCPTGNCCPVVVIVEQCCPVDCIPVTITKVR